MGRRGRPRKLFDGKIPAIGGNEVKLYAICVFGPDTGRPVKIACRTPRPWIEARPRDGDGMLHYNVWVVDRSQAKAIRQECHRVLDKAGKRIDEHRFDVNVEWAKKVIAFAGKERGITLFSDAEIASVALTRDELDTIDTVRKLGQP